MSGSLLEVLTENERSANRRYLVVHCYPSFAICLSFFAIAMSRLCRDG